VDAFPVLFIPGMMLDQRMYSAQAAALSAGYRVVMADITRSDSIEALASDVLGDAPPRFALVGLSMGAIVGLEVYRRAQERITHLALLDTTAFADRPERRAVREQQMAAAARGALAEVLREEMKPMYVAKRHRTNAGLLDRILEMGIDLGPDVFRRQSIALRDRRDYSAMLGSVNCPALVLCGREDQLCPVSLHCDLAASIARADLVVLAETGHLSAMEEPAAVTAALEHLLRRTR
jgi:pimeloyl-ACP methyl ester carboxylesterase